MSEAMSGRTKLVDGVLYPEEWVIDQCPYQPGVSCAMPTACHLRGLPWAEREARIQKAELSGEPLCGGLNPKKKKER